MNYRPSLEKYHDRHETEFVSEPFDVTPEANNTAKTYRNVPVSTPRIWDKGGLSVGPGESNG